MTPDTIFHTWYRNGHEIQKTAIEVMGSRFRAHTFKTVNERLAGTWKVQVTDRAGNVLAADSATVRAVTPPEE